MAWVQFPTFFSSLHFLRSCGYSAFPILENWWGRQGSGFNSGLGIFRVTTMVTNRMGRNVPHSEVNYHLLFLTIVSVFKRLYFFWTDEREF